MTDPIPNPDRALAETARLISHLQQRLLALGQGEDELPTADIERTAKAINQLIVSVGKANAYLRNHADQPQVGDRLTGERRQILLRKIKRMVENGILDEIDD